jgi:hypothetical protein
MSPHRRVGRISQHRCYSSRNATIGSNRAARSAGSKLAAAATNAKPESAIANVATSHGFNPNNIAEAVLPPTNASTVPITSPPASSV